MNFENEANKLIDDILEIEKQIKDIEMQCSSNYNKMTPEQRNQLSSLMLDDVDGREDFIEKVKKYDTNI